MVRIKEGQWSALRLACVVHATQRLIATSLVHTIADAKGTSKHNDDRAEAIEMASAKDNMKHDLVDREAAGYASTTIVEIDEATNQRLKRLIDKRVMLFIVVTYLV